MLIWVKKSVTLKNNSDIEIKIRKCHYSKYPINISNVDIDKIMTSVKIFLVKIVWNTLLVTRMMKKLNYYMLPKMSGYTRKHDDETKYILLIEGDELLKKYNNI